jgi:hypothetical protein
MTGFYVYDYSTRSPRAAANDDGKKRLFPIPSIL